MLKIFKRKLLSRLSIIFAILGIFILSKNTCHALSVVGDIECAKPGETVGVCRLSDFIVVAVNISQIILGLVGIASLFAFIYGGVMFLISGGSSDRVTKAKQILFGATVGLVIVFASYIIIDFALTTMGYTQVGSWQTGAWK